MISIVLILGLLGNLAFADKCSEFTSGELSGDNLLVTLSKTPGHQLRSDWEPSDLIPIPSKKIKRSMKLRREAALAFAQMEEAAAKDQVEIKVRSAYRSYDRQCALFKIALGKANGAAYVAHPGRSEHQLGTTVDIGQFSFDFQKTPTFHWLMLNAHKFGFTMSYSEPEHEANDSINDETGYAFEPWHWRYIGVEAATRRWGTSISLINFLIFQKDAGS